MFCQSQQETNSDGGNFIGKIWSNLNLSENTINLLKSSKSDGTWSQYKSSLDKWTSFCTKMHWNPEEKNIIHYVEFLSNLYTIGLSYNTINTARSAFSSVFGKVDNVPIGENKLIVDLMKGISRLRPVTPRYNITWDPDKVLLFLKSILIESCSLKDLSFKLIGLLALCTGQRVQTLTYIKLSNIHWGETVQIIISSKLKTTTVTKSNPILIIPPFHDSQLCPVKTLKQYVESTKVIRNGCDELFISFVKPHKKVCSQSISRWLVKLLKLAGIEDAFKAHSFRHASTSKAARNGVNMDVILRRVGWTVNSSVFARFYNRPVLDESEFAVNVLNIK